MRAIEITNIKKFMNQLLLGSRFDAFRLLECRITTHARYSIEGDVLWKEVSPYVLQIIKGHDTPERMKFVFALKTEQIPKLFERGNVLHAEDVSSLNFTIQYEHTPEPVMCCVTGFARSGFVPDREAEHYWDETMERFIGQMNE